MMNTKVAVAESRASRHVNQWVLLFYDFHSFWMHHQCEVR